MNLDHVQAELRPRLPWEAADLGLALGRQHAAALARAWLVVAWPVWLAAAVLLWLAPMWAWLPLWWLKPFMGVMPAFVLSRRLFGIAPTRGDTTRALWTWLRHRALADLTVARPRRRRGVLQIVRILEGPRTPKARLDLFYETTPSWLIKGCLLIELGLLAGLVVAVFWFGPSAWLPWSDENGGFEAWWDSLLEGDGDAAGMHRFAIIYTVAYAVAGAVSELIYLSCCFGCYLNTRAEIEGWDIEIAFKRLSRRVASILVPTTTACLVAACLVGAAPPASAQGDASSPVAAVTEEIAADRTTVDFSESEPDDPGASGSPEQTAARILDHPDFTIHRELKTRWRPDVRDVGSGDMSWLKPLVWVLAVLVILAVIAGLGWLVYKAAGWADQLPGRLPPGPSPVAVAGLDVRPESLPDDPLGTARQWWVEGRHRDALSLLYRAALSWMIHQGGVSIEEGDTEGECVRRVQTTPATAEFSRYFHQLTRAWLGLAYAGDTPAASTWDTLCGAWPFQRVTAGPASRPDPKRRRSMPWVLAALVLLTGCGRFEPREETKGFLGPARYNPFLAVSRLNEEYGVTSGTSFTLIQELKEDDGRFGQWVVSPSVIVNELSARQLLDRVASGDHAIVAVSDLLVYEEMGHAPPRWMKDEAPAEGKDPDRERESWRKRQLGEEPEDDDGESEAPPSFFGRFRPRGEGSTGERLRTNLEAISPGTLHLMDRAGVSFAAECDEFAVTEYEGRTRGHPEWDWPAAFVTHDDPDTPPARVLTVSYGDGRLTFLPSLRPFTNLRLANGQNASLWFDLIVDDDEYAPGVCFIRGSGASFFAVLWEHGWRSLVAAAAALGLWLWAVTKRFGPAPAAPAPAPATALASLAATGAFLVRQRQVPALLAPWSESLLARWRRSQPLEHDTGFDRFVADMAPVVGMSADDIRACFSPPRRLRPGQFIDLARRLWRLERAL